MKNRFLGFGLAALLLGGAASCGGSSNSSTSLGTPNTGAFKVESSNLANGDIWALNRSIVLRFNHPVDIDSIGFGSIIIRPTDPDNAGSPVTGEFSIIAGSGGKEVLFRPACPTNSTNSNGAFVPGGKNYELSLPTIGIFGTSILRDTDGRALEIGLTRTFKTPTAPTEPLFIDTVPGPPLLTSASFPVGLNLFSAPDPTIEIQFNQAIDGRASNLNLTNLFVVYSDDTVSNGPATFCGLALPNEACSNRVPGKLFLVENCGEAGAKIFFQVTGILPPDRYLQVVVKSTFRDISGQTNTQNQLSLQHMTPLLSTFYMNDGLVDSTYSDGDEAADEFRDDFDTTECIDPAAALQLPPASLANGFAQASFDFPGEFVPPDRDLMLTGNTYLEINTNGNAVITDSENTSFQVSSGVLNVDDIYIAPGATLRGRGFNPLIIYATGTVEILGTLDVSGNHANWPTGLNSPQFPEGGAKGECGGGNGGSASLVTDGATLRGEAGYGAFQVANAGGGGGEGGYNQRDGIGGENNSSSLQHVMSAGGGGGTFALTANISIIWERWSGEEVPPDFDNSGPDHREIDHPGYDDVKFDDDGLLFQGDIRHPVRGGEPGMRGTARGADSDLGDIPTPAVGLYGMEDSQREAGADVGNDAPFNPGTTWPGDMHMHGDEFAFGHPTRGPDPGLQGASVFSNDADLGDDFWGRRLNNDGTVTVGELVTPYAGAGGGAGGDIQIIRRIDLDGNGLDELTSLFFPMNPFLWGGNQPAYRKGAAGGGGGGQLLVMSIGPIIIGANARILSKGGIGHGGESIIYTYNQISGSGAGSGGHVVLNSATGFNLEQVDLPDFADSTAVSNYLDDPEGADPHPFNLRAIGGRRGWVGSRLTNPGPGSNRDGNPDMMVGRGGAGGNGLIQIHVPNPLLDINWDKNAELAIRQYMTNDTYVDENDPGTLDIDRAEDMLGAISSPKPFCLIPFFASGSQFQSKWVDVGLAGLHLGGGNYPDYRHADLMLDGFDAEGFLKTAGGQVDPITPVQVDLGTFPTDGFTMVVPSASTVFNINANSRNAQLLRNPELLVGYDIVSDPADSSGFSIASATYSRSTDTLTLITLGTDPPMTTAVGTDWSIRQKFVNVITTGQKDRLPDTASVRIEFQATTETIPGSNTPDLGAICPGPTTWYSDPADFVNMKGKRFFRYRVTFDIDALGTGATLTSERPTLGFVKVPFIW